MSGQPNIYETQRIAAPPACGVQTGDLLNNRFLIGSVLGWGGHAVVFRATDQQQGERIAVKVVRTDLPPDDYQHALEVLRWEARLLQRLRHGGLPRLVRFEREPQRTWLAREVIEGVPLAEWTAQSTYRLASPRSAAEVRGWAIQLCDLLRYLHTQSPPVIYADLKPANIIRRTDGTLALIDLGAAQTLTQQPARQQRPRYGTPGYAAPEQMGARDMDERADLFSLGVVCYELLTGIDPSLAPLQFDWQALAAVAPDLVDALRWALQGDLEQRAPTAVAWLAALQDVPMPPPFLLGYGVQVRGYADLLKVARQHPRLIEEAMVQRTLDAWLAQHPDPQLAMLLHHLRAARRSASATQRTIDTFYTALAPGSSSVALQVVPESITFGAVPLRHWRIWSKPRQLTLINPARHPARYDVVCAAQRGADVRVVQQGKHRRSVEGVLPPAGSVVLELVAHANKGKQQAVVQIASGGQQFAVRCDLEGIAGIPVGHQFVRSLDEISLAQPGLVSDLEELLMRGVLPRWLRAQGRRQQAAMVERATRGTLRSPLERRLLIANLLHALSPQRFPKLVIHGARERRLDVIAGERVRFIYEIENLGEYGCSVSMVSGTDLVQIPQTGMVVPPRSVVDYPVSVVPAPSLPPGNYEAALELWTGDLVLPLELPIRVLARHWWQRVARWIVGE